MFGQSALRWPGWPHDQHLSEDDAEGDSRRGRFRLGALPPPGDDEEEEELPPRRKDAKDAQPPRW